MDTSEVYMLRQFTLEGDWESVIKMYKSDDKARWTEIGGGRGTALHVAAKDGLENVVKEIIEELIRKDDIEEEEPIIRKDDIEEEEPIISKDDIEEEELIRKDDTEEEELIIRKDDIVKVLKKKNGRGDTPLHLAAYGGFKGICKLIIGENDERKDLIKVKNKSKETPLFLAALSWRKHAFAYLFNIVLQYPDLFSLGVLSRNSDGDTILHTAIRRDFFDLAVIIIHHCPMLNDTQNNNGITPLKLLAKRPAAFKSGSYLEWWKQIIYYGTVVRELDAHIKLNKYLTEEDVPIDAGDLQIPQNYLTCYQFILWFAGKLGDVACKSVSKNKGNEERSESYEHKILISISSQYPGETSQSYVPAEKKIKQSLLPPNYATCGQFVKDAFFSFIRFSGADESDIKQKPHQQASNDKPEPDSGEKIDRNETVFLIAARNGIVEIVKEVLSKIPSAIHDTNKDNMNVFHVAVENRQPLVVEALLKILREQNKIIIQSNLIQEVDNDDNTVLHLAAGSLISSESSWKLLGSAMQMIWDIAWLQYIKKLVPDHFVFRRNICDKTPWEIFKVSHEKLVKESSEWLKSTSESCSVVAALIAGVSFATVGIVPGGSDNGKPALKDRPAFEAFAISSLVGLFFSVTALIMFLSIIISRKQATDFRRSLPMKLLLGLTSLFVSTAAMFVSFCTGHFFVLNDKYRQYVFPFYIATCLPVTYYAVVQLPLYLDLLQVIYWKLPQPSDTGDDESDKKQERQQASSYDKKESGFEGEDDRNETSFLIAARNGIVEIVKEVLSKIPSAIHDTTIDNMNLFHVAVKREPQQASYDKQEPDFGEKIDRNETVFLIAARNGIVEIVKEVLSKIPSAIHDTNIDNMNVFQVAVKKQQPLVVEALLKILRGQIQSNLIQEVDKNDNTVLHLAAGSLSSEKPWKVIGSAMQMMWDIAWFQYIKKLVPDHFVFRRNKHEKTPWEIIKESHKKLVKKSSEWMKKTSESCSVVAALIAGVSFAMDGNVPGGSDNGKPALKDKPAFEAFAISSLVGLFFSVTALIMFLSILTSRNDATDFRRSLPMKLLLGLTSLFVSIDAMFVSFCTGHFFVLNDKYRQYIFPFYIATCLPVTYYAVVQLPLYLDLLQVICCRVPQPSDTGDGL